MERKCDNVLGGNLGVDEDKLTSQLRRTFESGLMDYFQRSFAWQCYRRREAVQENLHRYRSAVSQTCLRGTQEDETLIVSPVQ